MNLDPTSGQLDVTPDEINKDPFSVGHVVATFTRLPHVPTEAQQNAVKSLSEVIAQPGVNPYASNLAIRSFLGLVTKA